MRIGHITTYYKPMWGGQEVYVNALYDILNEQGFDQRVYQFDTGVIEPQIVQLKPMKFLQKRIGLAPTFNFSLLSKLNLLKNEDLLIVHYPIHYYPIWWHKNIVLLTHGVTWDCDGWLKKTIKKTIDSVAYFSCKKFVANDSFYYREMGMDVKPGKHLFEEVAGNKWLIPNCVDTDKFARVEPDKELQKSKLILVPRNISYARGIHLAISAFALFAKEHPETKLALAGDASEIVRQADKYKQFIKDLIKEYNLSARVIFLGRMPWGEMPRIYSSSIMTLIPSLGVEGTSLSALESMACGTATISTDRGGLLDLPTVHCEADKISLYNSMKEVYKNYKEIGHQQKKTVQKKFNLTNWKNAWLRVILGQEN